VLNPQEQLEDDLVFYLIRGYGLEDTKTRYVLKGYEKNYRGTPRLSLAGWRWLFPEFPVELRLEFADKPRIREAQSRLLTDIGGTIFYDATLECPEVYEGKVALIFSTEYVGAFRNLPTVHNCVFGIGNLPNACYARWTFEDGRTLRIETLGTLLRRVDVYDLAWRDHPSDASALQKIEAAT
jgi:hypothetical protein